MSNSSLATVKVPASTSNYTKGRSGRKIEMIAIHHMAGVLTAEQCGNIFKQVNSFIFIVFNCISNIKQNS